LDIHVFLIQAPSWLQPLLFAQCLSNACQSTMQLCMPSHADADSHATTRQQAHCHAEPLVLLLDGALMLLLEW
jgi:hypothetical protein